jgi:predicted O-methyltransferase YrrM
MSGALSGFECETLAHWAGYASGVNALEVGHYTGLSTSVLLESLPTGMVLWSVDHHRGDAWSNATEPDAFWGNVSPYFGRIPLAMVIRDFRDGLEFIPEGSVGFVFYDADHDENSVADFWSCVCPLLADPCVLLFDDADWPGMKRLADEALGDGFVRVTERDFHRGGMGKRSSDTYTLEVMLRE